MARIGMLGLAACLLWMTAGCSHQLQIKNFGAYAVPMRLIRINPPARVAIRPFAGTADDLFYFNALVERLQRDSGAYEVRTDWSGSASDFSPELVLSFDPKVAYRSSWVNIPINFPGFLLWIPAANGYVYKVDLNTDVGVYAPDGTELQKLTVPMQYNLRHSEFDRTSLAEISWFEVGIISLTSGIYGSLNFDPDLVQPFQQNVRENYASYVLNRVHPALLKVASNRPAPETGEPMPAVSAAPTRPEPGPLPVPAKPTSGKVAGRSSGNVARKIVCANALKEARRGARHLCGEEDASVLSFEARECECEKQGRDHLDCEVIASYACSLP